MVVVMFNKGVALSLAFTIAVVFLALAVAVHKMKAKYSSDSPSTESLLASLETHQVVLKIDHHLSTKYQIQPQTHGHQ